ncbi:MAG TPA: alpha-ketoacid dehydrogenase subunit beta [Candidatus Latescibacteria bacterium]|jgi:pyruvate dehydrogenase E1 component beta subunit|nr:alpha-ketoacid dehydrogenase subunit beta [Candidatus Latescibacterota bacterium]|tara:strand:- start:774 stop:1778 length:1005 start_codon:yes stop_codon:yes gene_type:complete
MTDANESESRTLLFRDGLNEALRQEMARDESVFCIGVGIAERGGSYKVTDGLLAEFGPKRCIDTPIAEPSIVGAAVGAAITGMRPVVEILFVDFTLLTMDQIVNQAAKYRLMSGGARSVPMVLRTQGGVGDGVAAQHSQSLEGLFYHIPGLKLVMPSTPRDARALLVSAIRDDEPVVFLEHKLLYMTEGLVPKEEEVIPLGVADIKRAGRDCTLIAWSNMIPRSLAAAAELAATHGIDVEVLDPRTLVPLDRQAIVESVCRTEHVVIVQEAVRRGGVAADIASIIQADAFDYLDAPVEIVAGRNTPIPYNRALEQACIPQTDDIIAAVRRAVYS